MGSPPASWGGPLWAGLESVALLLGLVASCKSTSPIVPGVVVAPAGFPESVGGFDSAESGGACDVGGVVVACSSFWAASAASSICFCLSSGDTKAGGLTMRRWPASELATVVAREAIMEIVRETAMDGCTSGGSTGYL